MPGIDDCQSLSQRIDSFMMIDITGHKHIRPFRQSRADHALSGSRRYSHPLHRFLRISEDFHTRQCQTFFDKTTALLQSHRFLQVSYSADPLVRVSLLQYLRILHLHKFSGKIRHSHHIIICMHSIICNIFSDQSDYPASDKTLIIDFF